MIVNLHGMRLCGIREITSWKSPSENVIQEAGRSCGRWMRVYSNIGILLWKNKYCKSSLQYYVKEYD